MVDLGVLVAFVPAAVLVVISPGPDTVYNLTQSLSRGPTAGIFAALGTATGIVVHTLAAVFGLAALLRASATAYQFVKYVGAAYLVYLGVQTIHSDEAFEITAPIGTDGHAHVDSYKQAAVINTSNPKVAVFVLAFFPQFVPPAANATVLMSVLGAVYAGLSAAYFIGVAFCAAHVRSYLIESALTQRAIRYGSGSMLLGFGLKLALERRPGT